MLVFKLVGDKIGLYLVVVIFVVLVGGYLFGFFGVLLVLLVVLVILVLLCYFIECYCMSGLYIDIGLDDLVIVEVDVMVLIDEGVVFVVLFVLIGCFDGLLFFVL